jgi:hypothetical protein
MRVCCGAFGCRLLWSFGALCQESGFVRLVMWVWYRWLCRRRCLTVINLWQGAMDAWCEMRVIIVNYWLWCWGRGRTGLNVCDRVLVGVGVGEGEGGTGA